MCWVRSTPCTNLCECVCVRMVFPTTGRYRSTTRPWLCVHDSYMFQTRSSSPVTRHSRMCGNRCGPIYLCYYYGLLLNVKETLLFWKSFTFFRQVSYICTGNTRTVIVTLYTSMVRKIITDKSLNIFKIYDNNSSELRQQITCKQLVKRLRQKSCQCTWYFFEILNWNFQSFY